MIYVELDGGKMTEFEDLDRAEVAELIANGESFLDKHDKHVNNLVIDSGPSVAVAPSGSDLFNPELWKAIHWRWFLNGRNEGFKVGRSQRTQREGDK